MLSYHSKSELQEALEEAFCGSLEQPPAPQRQDDGVGCGKALPAQPCWDSVTLFMFLGSCVLS